MSSPRSTVAVHDGVLDLVERGGDRDEVRLVELEREIGAWSAVPGWRSAFRFDVSRVCGVERDEARAVPVAHRRAMRKQRVAVAEVGVGVNRDRRDLELAAHRALVEALDVLQLVDVGQPFGIDLPGGERVEHERVVRVRAVGDVDGHWD